MNAWHVRRARRAGLPIWAGAAAARPGELRAQADAYRLAAQAQVRPQRVGMVSSLRRSSGALLVRAGQWLGGMSSPTAPSEREPMTTAG